MSAVMLPLSPASPARPLKPAPAIIYWVIWFGLTVSIPIYQFILGHGLPSGVNAPVASLNPVLILAVGLILAATALRWLVLSRFTQARLLLIVMVIGLGLSETAELLGIFLVP